MLIKRIIILPILIGGVMLAVEYFNSPLEYAHQDVLMLSATSTIARASSTPSTLPPSFIVTHLAPPEPVRAAYMTSCIASGKVLRAPLLKMIETSELNAVVIDIKDYTGMISFDAKDPEFVLNTKGCHVADMKEFIGEMHEKHIYVIGRVTVMQDSTYTKAHPNAAVKRRSNGSSWTDKKGLMFVDPGATEYWEHMVRLGKIAHAIGFDEINYDYIRFPSDGNMSDIAFTRTGSTTKSAQMNKFYTYLGREMRKEGIPISADFFGMTTTNKDDLGIGQIIEDALVNFDYVAPMVYPSHYPPHFNGWADPNLVPYELIKFVMDGAVLRADALEEKESGFIASTSTPKFVPTGKYSKKLRPWIQDFDYGKNYTEADVRAQMRGVYDANLTSWMSWDPSNKYTPSAYKPQVRTLTTP